MLSLGGTAKSCKQADACNIVRNLEAFLNGLRQVALSHVLYPLGKCLEGRVRQLAQKNGHLLNGVR